MQTIRFKFIQVNIFGGTYIDALLDFLKKEKPDFVSMQEVSYGNMNRAGSNENLFEKIRKETGMGGIFNICFETRGTPPGGEGNVVLSTRKILDKKVLILKDSRTMDLEDVSNYELVPQHPRQLIDALVELNGQKIHVMSVHGAWNVPPVDTEENLRQGRLIVEYLKSLGSEPFILGGDMNLPPETEVIKMISEVSNNLISGTDIKYTTHPTVHRIAPKVLLVDYIFTSKHFKPISVDAPLVVVSDHLPIVAELDFS